MATAEKRLTSWISATVDFLLAVVGFGIVFYPLALLKSSDADSLRGYAEYTARIGHLEQNRPRGYPSPISLRRLYRYTTPAGIVISCTAENTNEPKCSVATPPHNIRFGIQSLLF